MVEIATKEMLDAEPGKGSVKTALLSGPPGAGKSTQAKYYVYKWSQKEDVPGFPRHHPFQFGIDDFIYVGGGHVASWHKFD